MIAWSLSNHIHEAKVSGETANAFSIYRNNAAASLAVRVDEHRGQRFVSIPTVPWDKKARIPQAKRQREWDGRHSHTEYAKVKSRLRVTLGGKVANASGPMDFCTNEFP